MDKVHFVRSLIFAVSLCLFSSISAHSVQAAVAITFEGLADFDSVTNQFSAHSVFFTNATAAVAPPEGTLNEIDFPPTSGTTLVTNEGLGPMFISFGGSPVESVGGYFVYGDFELSGDPLMFSIYGPADAFVPLHTLALAENLGNPSLISFSGWGPIASLSVAGADGSYFTLDDLSFERTAVIPEPSTAALLILSLLSFGIRSKFTFRRS